LAYNQDSNQDLRDPAFSYTNPFRLKLYWEEGYFWQEEPNERECRFVSVPMITHWRVILLQLITPFLLLRRVCYAKL
jgi:hypothetical protein